ncbi:MAG: biotin--[acetyl-CoA-carboxylase] ligase [Coprococcus sp.]|nr:biotin--[acetyl-CoA-carboxylase] ligase [Coprococcus sp.]
MKNRILDILQHADGYVSGQQLCELLGVSRTAVWKNINSLKKQGYVIEGVNNKGYRLVNSPDVITKDKIYEHLRTDIFARDITYYDETDSTNTRAKLAAEEWAVHGALFVANRQNAGKGRKGHSWNSDKGTTISMTYLLKPSVDISCVSAITIVSAVAIARAFDRVKGLKPQIKWPNDVLSNGKKLVGILTEMSSEGLDINYVVVGIGINVYNSQFPEDIADKATSIFIENGEGYDRSRLIAEISNEFEVLYNEFVKNKNLEFIVDEYNSYLVSKDRQVYVIEGDKRTEYTALGLSPDGGLLVKDEQGATHNIISGEVSVRGIYGYV